MDSFSALSGHTNNLMKQLNGERLPPLHTRVILPLMVSSDKDMELEVRDSTNYITSLFPCIKATYTFFMCLSNPKGLC